MAGSAQRLQIGPIIAATMFLGDDVINGDGGTMTAAAVTFSGEHGRAQFPPRGTITTY